MPSDCRTENRSRVRKRNIRSPGLEILEPRTLLSTLAGDNGGSEEFAHPVYREVLSDGLSQRYVDRLTLGGSLSDFGRPGDIPVQGDFDGDGILDVAVYRPDSDRAPGAAEWLILGTHSGPQSILFGSTGLDIPVPADYDGDGRADLAVFRPNSDLIAGAAQWFILRTTEGPTDSQFVFGQANLDVPVPHDYDGDNRVDVAVFRPTTSEWFILNSTGEAQRTQFGDPDDIPAPHDYNGDGRADLATFRPTTGQWFRHDPAVGSLTNAVVLDPRSLAVAGPMAPGSGPVAASSNAGPGITTTTLPASGSLATEWTLTKGPKPPRKVPEVSVWAGPTEVADGTGAADFGTTAVGDPMSREFTVRNDGTGDLMLGPVSVPTGFALEAAPAATVPPGGSTALRLRFDPAAGGTYNGRVSFATNDADEDPYDFAVTASAEESSPPPPLSPAYTGRPEIPGLEAITPRITITRAEGTVPMMIQVSARDTTWTGPSAGDPFADLEYSWDFGDIGGGESFVNPVTGVATEAATGQVGPIAAYVYRDPGDYKITLNVRGWTGSEWIHASTSLLVTSSSVIVRPADATTGTYRLRAIVDEEHAYAARLNRSGPARILHGDEGRPVLPGADGMAASLWYRDTSRSASLQTIGGVYQDTNGNRAWRLQMRGDASGQIQLTVGSTHLDSTETGLNDGEWHHVLAWADVAAGKIHLQIDGGTVHAAARSGALDAPPDVPVILGRHLNSSGNLVNGLGGDLDEVAVWNRPLTTEERAWLYNSGDGQRYSEVGTGEGTGLGTGLQAWWSMDEDGGDHPDLSGNGPSLSDSSYLGSKPGVIAVAPAVHAVGGAETADIPHDATIREVAEALAALPMIGEGNVRAIGDELIEFGGVLAGRAVTLAPAPGTAYDGTLLVLGRTDGGQARRVAASDWDDERYETYYFDSLYDGSNGPADGTIDRPHSSATVLKTILESPGGGRRVLIRAGSTFELTQAIAPGNGDLSAPLLIGRYGDGPDPIIASATRIFATAGRDMKGFSDLTLDGLALVSAGDSVIRFSLGATTGATNPPPRRRIHLLDCWLEAALSGGPMVNVSIESGHDVGFWGSTFRRGAPPDDDAGSHSQGLGLVAVHSTAAVGCVFEGGGGGANTSALIHAHHVYWTVAAGSLLRWVAFRPASARASLDRDGYDRYRLNFAVKWDIKDGWVAPFALMDGCDVTGTQNGIGMGRKNDREPVSTAFDHAIIQSSAFHKSVNLGRQGMGVYAVGVLRWTFRDNLAWDNPQQAVRLSSAEGLGPDRVDAAIYRNRIELPDGGRSGLTLSGLASLYLVENLMAMPESGAHNANLVAVNWARLAAIDAEIDWNRWHYPGWPNPALFWDTADGGTMRKDFAAWRAAGFDPNGLLGNSG